MAILRVSIETFHIFLERTFKYFNRETHAPRTISIARCVSTTRTIPMNGGVASIYLPYIRVRICKNVEYTLFIKNLARRTHLPFTPFAKLSLFIPYSTYRNTQRQCTTRSHCTLHIQRTYTPLSEHPMCIFICIVRTPTASKGGDEAFIFHVT